MKFKLNKEGVKIFHPETINNTGLLLEVVTTKDGIECKGIDHIEDLERLLHLETPLIVKFKNSKGKAQMLNSNDYFEEYTQTYKKIKPIEFVITNRGDIERIKQVFKDNNVKPLITSLREEGSGQTIEWKRRSFTPGNVKRRVSTLSITRQTKEDLMRIQQRYGEGIIFLTICSEGTYLAHGVQCQILEGVDSVKEKKAREVELQVKKMRAEQKTAIEGTL